MRKRKSKKGEGLNKILDALSDAHLSAVSILLNVLDPDKPQFEKRRNHILGNKSTSVEKLLNILCKDNRARNEVFSWIATSPLARTAITDIIRRECSIWLLRVYDVRRVTESGEILFLVVTCNSCQL
jgi:hypothetical protein